MLQVKQTMSMQLELLPYYQVSIVA